jgi:hypothetical protein
LLREWRRYNGLPWQRLFREEWKSLCGAVLLTILGEALFHASSHLCRKRGQHRILVCGRCHGRVPGAAAATVQGATKAMNSSK